MGDPVPVAPESLEAPALPGTTSEPEPVVQETKFPEKFIDSDGKENVGALVRSYTELEHKQSTTPKAGLAIPAPPEVEPLDDNAGIEEILTKAGLDNRVITEQFRNHSKLLPDDYAAFKKVSPAFTRGIVDQFMGNNVQTVALQQTINRAKAVETVGGEEQFNTIMKWAETLPDAERMHINGLTADPATIDMAMEFLMLKHKNAVGAGSANPLIKGESAPAKTGGYASQVEMRAAMEDERYETNTAYKQSVDTRIADMDSDTIHGRRET